MRVCGILYVNTLTFRMKLPTNWFKLLPSINLLFPSLFHSHYSKFFTMFLRFSFAFMLSSWLLRRQIGSKTFSFTSSTLVYFDHLKVACFSVFGLNGVTWTCDWRNSCDCCSLNNCQDNLCTWRKKRNEDEWCRKQFSNDKRESIKYRK